MIDFKKTFEMLCQDTRSDIHEHLPTLLNYGKLVDHITEFGVRNGQSTFAWWYASPKTLRCYDINHCNVHHQLMACVGDKPYIADYKFFQANVLEIEIEETDLLFIDTYHTYGQLSKELALHGNKARRYLIFHDTVTFGEQGEDGKEPGLMAAIDEFMLENPHWWFLEIFSNNNGLTVLERG